MEASVITLNVKLEADAKQVGANWVARCVPLDIYAQSGTLDGSMAALKEAVELWFESCIDRHVLDKALLEAGFTMASPGDPLPQDANVIAMTRRPKMKPRAAKRNYIEVTIPAYTAESLSQPCAPG